MFGVERRFRMRCIEGHCLRELMGKMRPACALMVRVRPLRESSSASASAASAAARPIPPAGAARRQAGLWAAPKAFARPSRRAGNALAPRRGGGLPRPPRPPRPPEAEAHQLRNARGVGVGGGEKAHKKDAARVPGRASLAATARAHAMVPAPSPLCGVGGLAGGGRGQASERQG